jgi:hypothetical protein
MARVDLWLRVCDDPSRGQGFRQGPWIGLTALLVKLPCHDLVIYHDYGELDSVSSGTYKLKL